MTTCGMCGDKGNHYYANRCHECDLKERREKRIANHAAETKRVREWEMVARYGITLAVRDQMADEQNHCCLLCDTPEDQSAFGLSRLHVEHCHFCLAVRGLVCNTCNGRIQRHEKGHRVPEDMIDRLDEYIGRKCQLECRVRLDVGLRARTRQTEAVIV